MASNRRTFLKGAGATALGAGFCAPILAAWSRARASGTAEAHPELRWGMVIDTEKCLQNQQNGGCQACTDACHRVHNVPTIPEPERHEIKWIWREQYEHSFPDQAHGFMNAGLRGQDVTVLCNHCERPPCVRVCPTKATWKRQSDGIVMMDMHRCIGCRYCMAACPYGARSFNYVDPRPHLLKANRLRDDFPSRTKGVVEKCNFCAERLAKGLIPTCVETCQQQHGPNAALTFGNLYDPNSPVARILNERPSIRRKPALGTQPHVFYIV